MPPPPLPMSTPAPGSPARRPASRHASRAGNDAEQRRARVALRIGAAVLSSSPSSSSASSIETGGTQAATWQGYVETSNCVMARVPLQPRLTCCQKRSRPTPNGETTPMPLMTTPMRPGGRHEAHIIPGRARSRPRGNPDRASVRLDGRRRSSSSRSAISSQLLVVTFGGTADGPLRASARRCGMSRSFQRFRAAPQRVRAGTRPAHVDSARSRHLERSFYVWVASLLFIVVCWLWQPVPGVVWRARAGRVASAAGVCGPASSASGSRCAARRVIDVLRTRRRSRQPASSRRRSEFKTDGPYGWVRHPIYLGGF